MATDKFIKWRKQVLETKKISPIKWGMTQEDIITQFGNPDDVSTEKKPLIFKYSDIEFHFDKQNDYRLFLIYSDDKIDLCMMIDTALRKEIESICEQLGNGNHYELFKKGHAVITEFKRKKGTKEVAYNTMYALHLKYMDTDEQKMNLVDDWLDCICGWIGRPYLIIW